MIYAKPGDSAQQFGGTCPDGWVQMQSERPDGDYVASETGEWVAKELTYAEARKALNEQFYSDRDSLGTALANVQLLDGAEQEARIQDLQLDYADLVTQYNADVTALQSQYGV